MLFPPFGRVTFFACPKKSTKKKGARVSGGFAVPSLLAVRRAARKLVLRTRTVRAADPPPWLRGSAAPDGELPPKWPSLRAKRSNPEKQRADLFSRRQVANRRQVGLTNLRGNAIARFGAGAQNCSERNNDRYAILHNTFLDGRHVQTGSFNYTAAVVASCFCRFALPLMQSMETA